MFRENEHYKSVCGGVEAVALKRWLLAVALKRWLLAVYSIRLTVEGAT